MCYPDPLLREDSEETTTKLYSVVVTPIGAWSGMVNHYLVVVTPCLDR